jgi:hypothetical protein
MDVIWAKREGKYFLGEDWTGSISMIGFDNFAARRTQPYGVVRRDDVFFMTPQAADSRT